MTRTDWFRKPLIATCAVAALLLGPGPAGAGGTCPVPAADHLPAVPPGPLNIGTIKPLLLDYHAKFYNDDVAAVFDSAQKFMEQNAAQSKRPVIVLDIDETSLTNWPNLAPTILVSSRAAPATCCRRARAASINGFSSRAPKRSGRP